MTLEDLITTIVTENNQALKQNESIVGFATQYSREKFAFKLIQSRMFKYMDQYNLATASNLETLFIQMLEGCMIQQFTNKRYQALLKALNLKPEDISISGAFWLYED